jgi:hypothetical protein
MARPPPARARNAFPEAPALEHFYPSMNTHSFRPCARWLLAGLLTVPACLPGQTTTNPAPAVSIPAVRLSPAAARSTELLRNLSVAARARASTNAAATDTVPAEGEEAKDLATAIPKMNFDRGSSALLGLVRTQQAGGKLSEAEQFRLAVLLGDWDYIGKALKALPAEVANPAYTRLLESLAANSQSAAQFFQQQPGRRT